MTPLPLLNSPIIYSCNFNNHIHAHYSGMYLHGDKNIALANSLADNASICLLTACSDIKLAIIAIIIKCI